VLVGFISKTTVVGVEVEVGNASTASGVAVS